LDKLIIGFIYIWVTCLTPVAWAVPQEQDRAILEGNETNLLPNPGYEARTSGWSASGSSTLAIESTNPIKGKFSAKWDPSATGEFLDSELIQIESGFVGDRCQMEFKYRWVSGVTGEIKAVLRQFDDSAATESDVASIELTPTSGDLNSIIQLPMIDCPDDPADSYRFRLESTANAAEITIDKTFLGSGRNTFQLSQATFHGGVKFGNAGCLWIYDGSSSALPAVDADCVGGEFAVSGNALQAATDIPSIRFVDLPSGEYLIHMSGGRYRTTSSLSGSVGCQIFETNGPTALTGWKNDLDSTNTSQQIGRDLTARFRTTSPIASIEFQIRCLENQAASNVFGLSVVGTSGERVQINVYRYPLESAEAITLETSGEHWDVNIGGANVDLGTSAVTSYGEITNGSLDMVINTLKGSKIAQIPCSGSNPSTGLTCAAGNESPGIVIDTSSAGRYEACFYFSHATDADASGFVQSIFQPVETPNDDASTILQEGDTRLPSTIDNDSGASHGGIIPLSVCGTFVFNSPGQKTIRLFYEQVVAATITTNLIVIDRAATLGQRDMHITVEKMDEQFPTPIFTDLTNSLNSKVFSTSDLVRFESVHVAPNCTSSPCTMINPTDGITSITRGATGDYTVNFTAFITAPSCVVGSIFSGTQDLAFGFTVTTTSLGVNTTTVGLVDADSGFAVHCAGVE